MGLFCAKFTIEQESLDKWFEAQWKLHGATSRTPREAVTTVTTSDSDFHNNLVAKMAALAMVVILYTASK